VIVGRVEPGSYLLVADMDGVKMVSVDGSDEKSVYVAAVGRPFLSNLVALAYDPSSKIAYYSDVARCVHVLPAPIIFFVLFIYTLADFVFCFYFTFKLRSKPKLCLKPS